MTRGAFAVLFVFAKLTNTAPSAADPVTRALLTVSHVNATTPDGHVVEEDVAAPVAVRGAITVPPRGAMPNVQLVVRRVYDGHVFVTETATFAGERGTGGATSWIIPPFRLPQPDLGQGWEISAIATGTALPQGRSDDATIRRVARLTTDRILVRAATTPPSVPVDGACAIRITAVRDVYGQYVSATGKEIEVGLSAEVVGLIDRPRDAEPYLTVQPSKAERVWVMNSNRTQSNRHIRGHSYFGREGLDFGETFVLKWWVLPRPIAADRQYTENEWRAITRTACASSDDVAVRRRVGPGDLRITLIDRLTVDSGGPHEVNAEPTVEGDIEDPQSVHALRPNETVWIFTRPLGTEGWRVAALAIVQPDRLSWRAPALRFVEPGDHHVMAVAATTRLAVGRTLSPTDWYNLARLNLVRRLSRTIVVRPARADSEAKR